MKLAPLDLIVPILAAASCFLILLEIPVWAVFVGWAWYYALGAKPELVYKGIPHVIVGSGLAFATFMLSDVFAGFLPGLFSLAAAVFITVVILMLTLKVSWLSMSLISFNAYSCIFVGYAAGTFLHIEAMPSMLNAAIWISGANILGLVCGWLSIKLSGVFAKS